jgi:DNA repair exonuclease SbcCD nuclease subunit
MKILCIGDPHLRIEDEIQAKLLIKNINTLLTENTNINIIVILGDILHNHEKLHSASLNLALEFFKMCKNYCPTYCLVGNHDATNNTIFLNTNHWMNICKEWKNFTVVDKPIIIDIKGISLGFCPYVPDGRFVEAISTIKSENGNDWLNCNIVFVHQLFNGAKMGAIVAENVEEYLDDYPLCISGHIHSKQKIKNNLYYTGSSTYVGYGDNGKKYLMLINTEYNKKKNSVSVKLQDIDVGIMSKECLYLDCNSQNCESELNKTIQKVENIYSEYSDLKPSIKVIIRCELELTKYIKNIENYNKLYSLVDKVALKCIKREIISNNSEIKIKTEDDKFVNKLKTKCKDKFEHLFNKYI